MMKLHLGCYNLVHAGWINTDVTVQIFVARVPLLPDLLFRLGLMSDENWQRHRQGIFKRVHYLDVTRRFPYADNYFDYVFSSHMLEHLCPDEARFCLQEIYRVTKLGGIVRLAVPDLDQMVGAYAPENPEVFLDAMFQGRERHTHRLARHWWHYNEFTLTVLLRRIGFREITRCQFRQGRCADAEKMDNRPTSLFIEAEK